MAYGGCGIRRRFEFDVYISIAVALGKFKIPT